MKNRRVFCFCLLTFVLCSSFSAIQLKAKNSRKHLSYHGSFEASFGGDNSERSKTVKTPTDGGIREIIPDKYRERYEKWKNEFLSTHFGREQWDNYSNNKNFVLKIKLVNDIGQGGGTNDYEWDDSGNLVGATIYLGTKINKGYPDPIYYPVLNSLSITNSLDKDNENILAAVKIAHEFGHVNNTAKTNGDEFRRQNSLMIEYNKIFNSNNFNTKEPRLITLQNKLGGTPLDIWANREYWGETSAMFFLMDKLEGGKFYCPIVNRIEINIKRFAANYETRFSPVFNSSTVCQN